MDETPHQGAPRVVDPRVTAALDWCQQRGIRGLTLVARFPIDDETRRALIEHPEVEGLVIGAVPDGAIPPERQGVLLPEQYSWRLPARVGRHILYMGTRSSLTARMIRTALLRGVSSIVCWDLDDWRQWGVPRLAAGKVASRMASAILRLPEIAPRLAGRVEWGPVTRWLDAHYAKALERALSRFPRLESAGAHGRPGPVVFACPTLVAGGAERQIVSTAIGLRERGVPEVIVLVSRLRDPPGNDFFLRHLLEAGVSVRELESPVDSAEDWASLPTSTATARRARDVREALQTLPAELLQDVMDLTTVLEELQPAVLHCWLDYSNVRAGLAGLLAGVPRILLSGRNVSPVHFAYIHKPYMRAAYRLLAERQEVRLINNSRGGALDYGRWLGLPLNRFEIIYNGVSLDETSRASPEAAREFRLRHDIPEGASLIGGLFRFSEEKRPLAWLQVAATVIATRPKTYFLLFGQGPLAPQMGRFLRDLGLGGRIRIAPPTQESLLAISAFDILLLTSRWEGTPNVAIEAQALGTPVVASGGGGVSESLSPGVTGRFVETGRVQDLAQAVIELLDHPQMRAAMGAAGPGFIHQRFSQDRMIDETCALYGWARGTRVPDGGRRSAP